MDSVLVVDDDAGIRTLLADYLTQQGLRVLQAADGDAMRAALRAEIPGLVVMDLMLPGEDGLSLTRWLKTVAPAQLGVTLPVIMLSARGEDVDRIVGLEVGADDYLPKPFNPRELLARIRAVGRRPAVMAASASSPRAATGFTPHVAADSEAASLRFGVFQFDRAARRLLKAGEEVSMTTAEYRLLEVFVTQPHVVLSRDQIMAQIKGYERDPMDRSIDVGVTRLRRKIEADPAHPKVLRTVWGQGYLFAPEAAEGSDCVS